MRAHPRISADLAFVLERRRVINEETPVAVASSVCDDRRSRFRFVLCSIRQLGSTHVRGVEERVVTDDDRLDRVIDPTDRVSHRKQLVHLLDDRCTTNRSPSVRRVGENRIVFVEISDGLRILAAYAASISPSISSGVFAPIFCSSWIATWRSATQHELPVYSKCPDCA
jgi:hypothetical protein